MTARERLAFYSTKFALAEIATTFRFPPTPQLCAQWAERTPDGFVFDLRVWSLLVGAPTLPDSLWPDLQDSVIATARDRSRLYASHLPAEVVDECWARFAHALVPLQEAGKLGALTLSYPAWFGPRPDTWEELSRLRARLPGCQVAVELHNQKWFAGEAAHSTFEWLEERGIGFVCVDGPTSATIPAVLAVTSDIAMVRFRGRRAIDGERWSWPYRYADDELSRWVPRIKELAASATDVHVIMDNCWRSDAVDNALTLERLLRESSDIEHDSREQGRNGEQGWNGEYGRSEALSGPHDGGGCDGGSASPDTDSPDTAPEPSRLAQPAASEVSPP